MSHLDRTLIFILFYTVDPLTQESTFLDDIHLPSVPDVGECIIFREKIITKVVKREWRFDKDSHGTYCTCLIFVNILPNGISA